MLFFFATIGCIYSKEQIIFLMGEYPSNSHQEFSFTITVLKGSVRDAQLQQHLRRVIAAYKHYLPRTMLFFL